MFLTVLIRAGQDINSILISGYDLIPSLSKKKKVRPNNQLFLQTGPSVQNIVLFCHLLLVSYSTLIRMLLKRAQPPLLAVYGKKKVSLFSSPPQVKTYCL